MTPTICSATPTTLRSVCSWRRSRRARASSRSSERSMNNSTSSAANTIIAPTSSPCSTWRACAATTRLPLAVDVGELAPRGDALIAQRQAALLGGDLPRELEQRRGRGSGRRRRGRRGRG